MAARKYPKQARPAARPAVLPLPAPAPAPATAPAALPAPAPAPAASGSGSPVVGKLARYVAGTMTAAALAALAYGLAVAELGQTAVHTGLLAAVSLSLIVWLSVKAKPEPESSYDRQVRVLTEILDSKTATKRERMQAQRQLALLETR